MNPGREHAWIATCPPGKEYTFNVVLMREIGLLGWELQEVDIPFGNPGSAPRQILRRPTYNRYG